MAQSTSSSPPLVKTKLEWRSRERHQQIAVVGSWTGFSEFQDLQYCGGGIYAVDLMIPKGERYYRFLIDDEWETDDQLPKTILHGDEYNVIQVGDDDEEDDEDDTGDALIMQGGSFVVGKSKGKKGRKGKRGRGRPSMEIRLPENFMEDTMDQMEPIAEEGDDAGGRARKKRKKRRRRKRPKAPRAFEAGDNQNLQELFKQKEEEWARMCFVQQLRQQQQHNDEINRVKTLWKQERQVRVEMHKKVMQQKKGLDAKVNQLSAKLESAKLGSDTSAQAERRKANNLQGEQQKWSRQHAQDQEEIVDLRQQLRSAEDDKQRAVDKIRSEKTSLEREMADKASHRRGASISPEALKKMQAEKENLLRDFKNEKEQLQAKYDKQADKDQRKIQELNQEKEEYAQKNSTTSGQVADLEGELAKAEGEMKIQKNLWTSEREALENQVAASKGTSDRIIARCKQLNTVTKGIRKHMDDVKNLKIDEMQQMNQFFPNVQDLLTRAFTFNQSLVEDLMDRYKRELSLRRKYFNMVQDLRGNIRVFCRVRPLLPFEKKKGYTAAVKANHMSGDVRVKHTDQGGGTKSYDFSFDKVFDDKISQEDLGMEASEYVISTMDGYNVSIFAYGQTGSGKTYTMDGPENSTDLSMKGVNYRALKELFRMSKERAPMFEYTISCSVIEIYNEGVNDLLSDKEAALRKKCKGQITIAATTKYNKQNPNSKLVYPHKIRMNDRGHVYADGVEDVQVNDESEVLELVNKAKSNRATSSTDMNAHSSRSHMILIVDVQGFNIPANIEYSGKLFLVDLAGSERVGKSGVTGQALKEAQNINKSLSALGDVMGALQKKTKHVPYRNSTLTHLMQNALGGNAKTIMFINICPTKEHTGETVCSLQFAQRVAKVQLGQAKASKKSKGKE